MMPGGMQMEGLALLLAIRAKVTHRAALPIKGKPESPERD